MALELEHRHEGRLGLRIVPVGLTYSAKEVYRSDALVHFGEPITVAEFVQEYAEHRKECIHKLTAEIERRIQLLILHIPQLEHARVVAGVKRLYLDHLRVGPAIVHEPHSPRAEELQLSQRIAAAVEEVYRAEPERAAAFAARLAVYERWLARLRIPDEYLALFPDKRRLAGRSVAWAALAVLGSPIALYGWLHRLIPFAVVKWAVGGFTQPTKRKAQASTAAITAGVVAFGVCYTLYVALFHAFFGWPASLWYALSLPVTSLVAYYYLRQARLLAASARSTIVLLRAPSAATRLLALRTQLIADIEQSRQAGGAAPETELLLFKASSIHGKGAFAAVAIRKGMRVLEYVGERVSKAESLRRCVGHNEYIFALNSEQDLDGNVAWNPARFINHSCAPNCEAQREDGHIWIVARRDIQPGEEITFNYAYDLEDYQDYPCHCGSPGCVGYIVAEEFFDHVRNRKA